MKKTKYFYNIRKIFDKYCKKCYLIRENEVRYGYKKRQF